MSLFKRKKAGEEANTIPEAMDDITQTLLIPVKDEGDKTMCADAYETSQAEIASYTSIGTRKSQQDSICFDFGDFCTVCAVCDGMGGLTGGERASALAAHGVTRYLLEHAQAEDIPTEMGRAALRLNEEVKNLRDPANQKIEAGTTLTTVFLRNGELFWCSVGDSHIYLYRDGTLEQLNIDHNFGAQLDQMALEGNITQDEALHHPQRAALTSYLGISELTLISGNRMPFQLRKGDVLIQCTDGLYRYLPDSTMCRILAVTGNLKQAAEQMVKTALAVPGGHDNTSVLLARSSTENFLLYSAMKAKGYENAYFGYSDKSSEGNWKWVNGTSTAYTNWHSGEPNNQDGIEHYAMFYENFQDETWNDADGIIDAGCAYICEWDDPTDKISQGDSFTDQQLRIIAKDLGVPDDLNVEIRQSPKAYWESAGLWDIYVEITHNGKLVASGSFDVETGEMGRNIYIYTPV